MFSEKSQATRCTQLWGYMWATVKKKWEPCRLSSVALRSTGRAVVWEIGLCLTMDSSPYDASESGKCSHQDRHTWIKETPDERRSSRRIHVISKITYKHDYRREIYGLGVWAALHQNTESLSAPSLASKLTKNCKNNHNNFPILYIFVFVL